MMGEQNWLSPLEMGITRHNNITVFFCRLHQSLLHIQNQLLYLYHLATNEHVSIQSHLIVAATGGMKPATGITYGVRKTLFNIHVNIFQSHLKGEFAFFYFLIYVLQASDNSIPIRLGNNTNLGQHGGMGNRASNILGIHPLIKIN